MNKSDSIGKLAEALAKAQGAMKNAVKDSNNPFFKSKYADLASVSDACRNELAANGLAVTQLPTVRDGKVVLEYVLMHSSGEWIGGEIEMNPVKADPQGIGSAITYARRYSLAALTGVATEDDDGNAASGNKGTVDSHKQQAPPMTFKKSAAINNDQGANQTQKGHAPDAADIAPVPTVEIPGADCIDVGQAANFHKLFRDSLPPKLRKDAEALVHDWLKHQGIVDVIGKPSALAIKKESFYEVREQAVEFARTFSI